MALYHWSYSAKLHRDDLNVRPIAYQTIALPTELRCILSAGLGPAISRVKVWRLNQFAQLDRNGPDRIRTGVLRLDKPAGTAGLPYETKCGDRDLNSSFSVGNAASCQPGPSPQSASSENRTRKSRVGSAMPLPLGDRRNSLYRTRTHNSSFVAMCDKSSFTKRP